MGGQIYYYSKISTISELSFGVLYLVFTCLAMVLSNLSANY